MKHILKPWGRKWFCKQEIKNIDYKWLIGVYAKLGTFDYPMTLKNEKTSYKLRTYSQYTQLSKGYYQEHRELPYINGKITTQ